MWEGLCRMRGADVLGNDRVMLSRSCRREGVWSDGQDGGPGLVSPSSQARECLPVLARQKTGSTRLLHVYGELHRPPAYIELLIQLLVSKRARDTSSLPSSPHSVSLHPNRELTLLVLLAPPFIQMARTRVAKCPSTRSTYTQMGPGSRPEDSVSSSVVRVSLHAATA